jgi:hypothetical protein
MGHDGRMKRTRKLRAVRHLPSLSITLIATSPYKAGDGDEDLLCGSCGEVVVSGYGFGPRPKDFANKNGCFITCHNCTAYNEVTAPSVS